MPHFNVDRPPQVRIPSFVTSQQDNSPTNSPELPKKFSFTYAYKEESKHPANESQQSLEAPVAMNDCEELDIPVVVEISIDNLDIDKLNQEELPIQEEYISENKMDAQQS